MIRVAGHQGWHYHANTVDIVQCITISPHYQQWYRVGGVPFFVGGFKVPMIATND
jgi:hypothetical protein